MSANKWLMLNCDCYIPIPENHFNRVKKMNSCSLKGYQQNGTLTSIINSSKFSPPWENGDQLLEKSRREQVVISRFCIGHTRLTHAFILQQEPQPQCLTCQTTCTVKHILIECRDFAVIRKRFFKVTCLTELFDNVKIGDVLFFLRETGLYEKIRRIKTG